MDPYPKPYPTAQPGPRTCALNVCAECTVVQLGGFCAAGMAVSCTSTGPAPGGGGGAGGPGAGGGPGGELPIVTLIAAFALRSMRTA